MKETYDIPDDFLIGTSSSAWQIEGVAGRSPSQKSWADLFYETNPDIWYEKRGPQVACDFYHRYREDVRLMAQAGMRAFRFTIQWARFMEDPIAGVVSQDAVVYYADVIRAIRDSGMEPVVSLEHWDIPAVLFEKYDGWVGRETATHYRTYVREALKAFHDDVKYWFAFTEPNIPIDNGYMDAIWYPFLHAPKKAYQAHFHKVLATAYAVEEARAYRESGLQMGAMIHLTPVYAASDEEADQKAAFYGDLFHVRIYLDPYLRGAFPDELLTELKRHDCMFAYEDDDLKQIATHRIDLLGVDYYFPIRAKRRENEFTMNAFHPTYYYEPYVKPDRRYNSDRGWEIYPEAIVDFGERIKKEYDNFPWMVTENGIGIANEARYRNADGTIEDDYRISFIEEHLKNTLQAKQNGANVSGYLIWSYVDNVSAINAFKNRYGLLELDVETLERRPKKSYNRMKEIMRERRV